MQPRTQFAEVPGTGTGVAYQVLNGTGPDLVYSGGSFNHVDVFWEDPAMTHFLRRLNGFSRVIVFDRRGAGASDHLGREGVPTLDDWMADLQAVRRALDLERFALMASIDACAAAIRFAAEQPSSVSHLVLLNATARMLRAEGYPQGLEAEACRAIASAMGDSWGTEEAAAAFYPERAQDEAFLRWYAKYQRAVLRRSEAPAVIAAALAVDVRDQLASVHAPTLVLHRDGYIVPQEQAQYLHEHLPHSRLVHLPGSGTLIGASDVDDVADHVEQFLTGDSAGSVERVLATVLFTDIVSSTELVSAVGDLAWRNRQAEHDEVNRQHVERFGGRVVATTGDGVLGVFSSPAKAVRCAAALRSRHGAAGLAIRAGIHAGEVELQDGGGISGLTVHLAARVMAAAGPQEVWLSNTVVDLVTGSGLSFSDQGERHLKGVPAARRLFRLEG